MVNVSPTLRIRGAASTDVAELAGLVRHYWAYEDIDGYSEPKIRALLAEVIQSPQKGRVFVADEGGALIGYLLATCVFSLEHGGMMAEIDEFFTAPQARSQGVGGALLRAMETWAAECGHVRIELQLGKTNARARGFYLRNGFAERSDYELLDKAPGAESRSAPS